MPPWTTNWPLWSCSSRSGIFQSCGLPVKNMWPQTFRNVCWRRIFWRSAACNCNESWNVRIWTWVEKKLFWNLFSNGPKLQRTEVRRCVSSYRTLIFNPSPAVLWTICSIWLSLWVLRVWSWSVKFKRSWNWGLVHQHRLDVNLASPASPMTLTLTLRSSPPDHIYITQRGDVLQNGLQF